MYDNACKYLAETFPAEFVRWLLSLETENINIIKTELIPEPIRADALILLQIAEKILHIEFQTLPQSNKPVPFRMLKYWVTLYDKYECEIEQVVIFLKRTTAGAAYTDFFAASNTRHRYRVIRLWEQDPAPLLGNPALLPLATLAQTNSPESLLQQVAQNIASIEDTNERANILVCADILAGLRFEAGLIRQFFTEEMMEESVTYQAILEKGVQRGVQQGIQQGLQRGLEEGRQREVSLVTRQLTRRLGELEPALQERLRGLSLTELEDLGEALLDFQQMSDLTGYLNRIGG